jgi:hypothetical protein
MNKENFCMDFDGLMGGGVSNIKTAFKVLNILRTSSVK